MEFFEFVLAMSVVVGLPSVILYNVRRMKEAKYLARGEQQGSALRTSELEVMIEDAVQRAVQPLEDRMDVLEGGEAFPPQLEAPKSPLLGREFDEFDDEPEPASLERRRVQS